MIVNSARFSISNSDVRKCPDHKMHEYAFIGRSNVGKSSLINMLTGHKGLAMTSATPGKTMLINHFLINDSWYIVDLPGYGYARRGKDSRHEASLGFESLIRLSARYLDDDGLLAFISPADRESDIVFAMSIARMHIAKKTYIKTTHAKSPKRILWLSGKKNIATETTTLIIHGNDSGYTDEYISLTSPFYLHL